MSTKQVFPGNYAERFIDTLIQQEQLIIQVIGQFKDKQLQRLFYQQSLLKVFGDKKNPAWSYVAYASFLKGLQNENQFKTYIDFINRTDTSTDGGYHTLSYIYKSDENNDRSDKKFQNGFHCLADLLAGLVAQGELVKEYHITPLPNNKDLYQIAKFYRAVSNLKLSTVMLSPTEEELSTAARQCWEEGGRYYSKLKALRDNPNLTHPGQENNPPGR